MVNPVKSDKKTSTNPLIRFADLSQRGARNFDIVFTKDMLAAAADTLSILDVGKMRLTGSLRPEGDKDWLLEADAGASVVQECGVTLAPVKTRIDEKIRRHYVADWEEPDGESVVEMDENDEQEPLAGEINLEQVALEAISLALPAFPRSEGASLENAVFTEPGVAPMTDDDVKPFAALAALKDKLDD